MSVLRNTLELYGLPFPDLTYSCTLLISKSKWPELLSFRLSAVAKLLGIEFEHHNAEQDALACAQIGLCASNQLQVNSIDELCESLNVSQGRIFAYGDYSPASGPSCFGNGTSSHIDVDTIVAESDDFDKHHPFYRRLVTFTGTLESMNRHDAMQLVVNAGGEVANTVSKHTNVLVIGEQDFRVFASGKTESSKMEKAKTLKEKGCDIEIISEDDFLRMV